MAKRSKVPRKGAVAVDSNLLYARAKAKQVRAHNALEREIMRLATQLEKLRRKRNESLLRLAESIIADLGTHEIVVKVPAV